MPPEDHDQHSADKQMKELLEFIEQKKKEQVRQNEQLSKQQQGLRAIDLAVQDALKHIFLWGYNPFSGMTSAQSLQPQGESMFQRLKGIDKGLEDHKRWLESQAPTSRTYAEAEILAELGIKE